MVHFYFNYQDGPTQTAFHVVACLLKQLIATSKMKLPSCLEQLYEDFQHNPQIRRPHPSNLVEMFIECTKQFPRVFIMLDGFDECGLDGRSKEEIVDIIEALDNAGLNVFVTAHTHSLDALKRSKSDAVEIRASEEDIRNYIEANLPRSVDEELKAKVVKTIHGNANGMYEYPCTSTD
jgi:hypothetical protein